MRVFHRRAAGCRWLSSRIVSSDECIQQLPAPPDVVQWYRDTFGRALPRLEGALLDIPRMKRHLEFYRRIGVSVVEFGDMVSYSPHVMALDHTQASRKNLMYLLSRGLSTSLICHVVMKMPQILSLSLAAHIQPRMAYYQERLLLSDNEMLKIFEECPEFLQYSIIKDIRYRVKYLMRIGLSLEEVAKSVILECPQVLGSTYHTEIYPRLEFLRNTCFSACLKNVLCRFPNVMLLSKEDQLRPFARYFLDELNMGRRLFGQMLEIYPHVLAADVDRDIRPKIEYLKKFDLDQLELFRILVHRPQILKHSLKEGLAKKMDEMRSMGVPPDLIRILLLKSPRFFV